MGPFQAITTCLRKSFQFSGRASRSEYWWFFAFVVVAVGGVTGLLIWGVGFGPTLRQYTVLVVLVGFLLTAAGSRRMQDSGLSGAVMVAPIIGIILGWIAISTEWLRPHWLMRKPLTEPSQIFALTGVKSDPLFWGVIYGIPLLLLWILLIPIRRSDPGPNRYGPNPIEVTP